MTNAHKTIRTTAQFEQVKRLLLSIRGIDFPNQRTNNTKIKIIISLTSPQGFKGFAQRGRIKERKIFMETKTKRIFAAIIAFCMLTVILPMTVIAENPYEGSCGQNGGNLNWSYNETTKTLTISGTGDMSDYDESVVNGGYVAPWRRQINTQNIQNVVISDGVTSIGDFAFYLCDKINNITISDSVTSIGDNAFLWCDSLPEVKIPNSVTHIGERAFSNCTALTSIIIPGSVTDIGKNAFYDCSDLTAITLSEGVKNIGESAFNGCSITEITIPISVTRIGDWAFNGCAALTSINFLGIVKSIGYQAFYNTGYYLADGEDSNWENNALYIGDHLIEIDAWKLNNGILKGEIPSEYIIKPGTKTIADMAFTDCKGYIEYKDFENCVGLTSIKLPDGMVNIGNGVFDSCTKLASIEIPKSVKNIGNSAFSGCISLTGINVSENNTAYCSENGVLYNKAKTEIMRFPCQKTDTSFTIPNGVTGIANGAFENCRNLTGITIPKGAKSIGDDVFSNCEGLTSITIPDGVTSIGSSAFYECIALTSAVIPNTVTSIGNNAFLNRNKLKDVYYDGSAEDWIAISKGENYSIADDIITYCAGIKITPSNDGKIVVKPCNIDAGKTVILALYDGDKFVEMQQSSEYSETKREITFTPTEPYTRAKVMIWNSFSEMAPVCDFKSVE